MINLNGLRKYRIGGKQLPVTRTKSGIKCIWNVLVNENNMNTSRILLKSNLCFTQFTFIQYKIYLSLVKTKFISVTGSCSHWFQFFLSWLQLILSLALKYIDDFESNCDHISGHSSLQPSPNKQTYWAFSLLM